MKIPYPVVSKTSPFFYLNVSGIDLTSIVTTGVTQLQVYRVWKNTAEDAIPPSTTSFNMPPYFVSPYNIPPYFAGSGSSANAPISPVNYAPIDQKNARFTFVFDSNLFNMDGGRYRADFYYKGTYVASTYLVYAKPDIIAVGSANV